MRPPKEQRRVPPDQLKRLPMGGGRPVKTIDLKVVEQTASIGCTPDEIAAVCEIGRSTFYDHMRDDEAVRDAIDRGREKGRATLRRLQWQGAMKGNPTMLIWLGKQILKQRDHMAISPEDVEDASIKITGGLPE